jgi:hypothetical protein
MRVYRVSIVSVCADGASDPFADLAEGIECGSISRKAGASTLKDDLLTLAAGSPRGVSAMFNEYARSVDQDSGEEILGRCWVAANVHGHPNAYAASWRALDALASVLKSGIVKDTKQAASLTKSTFWMIWRGVEAEATRHAKNEKAARKISETDPLTAAMQGAGNRVPSDASIDELVHRLNAPRLLLRDADRRNDPRTTVTIGTYVV